MLDFNFIPVLLEQTATTVESNSESWLSAAAPILMLAVVIVAFYFLLIRPQKKKEKEDQKMRNSIVPGDTVTTIGGIVGVVRSVKDEEDVYIIESGADKNRNAVKKWAVQSKDNKDSNTAAPVKAEKDTKSASETKDTKYSGISKEIKENNK